jgi:hypothetical protein
VRGVISMTVSVPQSSASTYPVSSQNPLMVAFVIHSPISCRQDGCNGVHFGGDSEQVAFIVGFVFFFVVRPNHEGVPVIPSD